MYEPADKLGLYGLNPLLDPSKRTYVATGDSGQVLYLLVSWLVRQDTDLHE